jgi:hypothetical protein
MRQGYLLSTLHLMLHCIQHLVNATRGKLEKEIKRIWTENSKIKPFSLVDNPVFYMENSTVSVKMS